MYILIPCTNCHKLLRARTESAGKSIRCWSCRQEVLVPAIKEEKTPAYRWSRSFIHPVLHQQAALFGSVAIALACVALSPMLVKNPRAMPLDLSGTCIAAGFLVVLAIVGVREQEIPTSPELPSFSWTRSAIGALMAGGVILAGIGPRMVNLIVTYNRQQPFHLWPTVILTVWMLFCFVTAPAVWLAVTARGRPWAANPWTVGRSIRRTGRVYLEVIALIVAALVLAEVLVFSLCWMVDLLNRGDLGDPTRGLRPDEMVSPLRGWWQGLHHGQLLLWDLPIWFSDAHFNQNWIRYGTYVSARDISVLAVLFLIIAIPALIGAYTWAVAIHRLELVSTLKRGRFRSQEIVVQET